MKDILITKLDKEKLSGALSLVWDVFLEFESPDYTQEGIDEFYKSIHDQEYINMLTMYAAYKQDKMLGIIATRSNGTHIALFFVDGKYHRQGIGRQLFEVALKDNHSDFMTVNSSPYATVIYHKLGFVDTDDEQIVKGLRFTPMKRLRK